jgi:hypothetical protein
MSQAQLCFSLGIVAIQLLDLILGHYASEAAGCAGENQLDYVGLRGIWRQRMWRQGIGQRAIWQQGEGQRGAGHYLHIRKATEGGARFRFSGESGQGRNND